MIPLAPAPAGEAEKPLASGQRILWFGFASLLVLMALIGFDVTASLRRTTERNAALMKGFRERDHILDELREAMIQSGVILRDFLAERDPLRSARERLQIEQLRMRTEELLRLYGERIPPAQTEMFADLRTGVRAYWKLFAPSLQWSPQDRAAKGEAYRLDAVGPLRSEVLRLRHEINRLNQNQLDAGEDEIAAEHSHLRNRLILAAALAVAIGCFLAVMVMWKIRSLERAAAGQYRRVSRARQELRELAARLEAAQEEERKNLSRELHDEVGQTMSALLMDLAKLELMLPGNPAARAQLSQVRKAADSSVKCVRNMALLLRPSMLDDLGLAAALKWQGRETARRSGLKVSVDVDPAADDLPDSYRTSIYRVVQESLNNVVKHSRAAGARVLVRMDDEGVEISVQDNGAGFDTAAKGVGLLGMEERVARLGGALRVESRRGEGTVVTAVLPLETKEAVYDPHRVG